MSCGAECGTQTEEDTFCVKGISRGHLIVCWLRVFTSFVAAPKWFVTGFLAGKTAYIRQKP